MSYRTHSITNSQFEAVEAIKDRLEELLDTIDGDANRMDAITAFDAVARIYRRNL